MTTLDDWSLTEFQPGDATETWWFRKNLAPAVPVGDPHYPYLAYLTFKFGSPLATRRPTSQEFDDLECIENSLFLRFSADPLAIQVGAVLKPGLRDLLFYTREVAAFEVVAQAQRADYPAFDIKIVILEDRDWSQYKELP
jgi:Family of unknown function (DUF695)